MSIFIKEGNVKNLYFKDDEFLPEKEVSDEYVEIKESIPYGMQSMYQQKITNALVYSGSSVVKVKPEAYDVDIWLLAQVIKGVTYLNENGEVAEYTPKSIASLEKDLKELFVTKFVNGLIAKVKDYYGIQQEEKKDESVDLGE
ncbi:MAG: hypothetical protein WC942_04395 [Clostridia bacterium]|jgi:hypothetical protein